MVIVADSPFASVTGLSRIVLTSMTVAYCRDPESLVQISLQIPTSLIVNPSFALHATLKDITFRISPPLAEMFHDIFEIATPEEISDVRA